MLAYVSLHMKQPEYQLDGEVSYCGYRRVQIEFDDAYIANPIRALFPPITKSSDDVVTWVAVGACEEGQGEIFMRYPALPTIHLKDEPERRTKEFWLSHGIPEDQVEDSIQAHGWRIPHVCIANTETINLPDNLNPIARVAHGLIYSGLMRAEDLHPKLYETINDALHNAGVPVIPIIRQAAGKLDIKMANLRLGQWGHA